ncbi:tripartite tricarboxylate transporter TctB family protein [Microvirga makkahensis]|uniref:DUF1468 domain-containing protein n=1 Tax=Microvirga makkahensis TaxID=1128670 RepID=A0A7X3MWH9_9HYPH|nr:tripartite tricarboxylate transporter TctB family protein [Microvirga makkahensis]MXQ14245.1 hypothetical protein [Microvirga makkahensis]
MSSLGTIRSEGGGSAALPLAQKLIVVAAALAFFAAFFWIAMQMPPVRAAGDVGSAFLPLAVAALGFGLSLIYLLQIVVGRDGTRGLARPVALALLVLTLVAVASFHWIGMPVALGLGAGLMVIVLERGDKPFWAIGTGIVFWALTQFGFGMLLGVPLL